MGRGLDAIGEAYPGLILRSENTIYFGIGRIGDAVNAIAGEGWAILGFEGFSTDGSSVVPDPDFVCDLSTLAEAESSTGAAAEAAQSILAKWRDGPEFVEFTLRPGGVT